MVGAPLLEGQSVIARNGRIHIVRSASASWLDDYTLGRITYSGGDILHWSAWIKHDYPVFVKNPAGHAYGRLLPGLADTNAVSFESVNFPGQFLRHRDGLRWLSAPASALDNSDATFFVR
jgi:GH43 family beta-xylosidase